MNSMTTFMHHGGYIMHLSGSIHKNKRGATFCQRAIVTSGSFAIPAFQVKVLQGIHLFQAISKEGAKLRKTFNGFIKKFFSGFKWSKRFCSFRFSFYIPGTQISKL